MSHYYPPSYYGEGKKKFVPLIEMVSRTIRKVFIRSFVRSFPGRSVLLEIGCGRGDILSEFARIGWECHGTESSTSPISSETRMDGWKLHSAPTLVQAGFPSDRFDIIICRHVLEHLDSPGDTLREAARILKPGGRLYLVVPNYGGIVARVLGASWFALDVPRHLFHFTPVALTRLLHECGFRVIRQTTLSFEQDVFTFAQSAQNALGLPFNGFYDLIRNRSAQLGSRRSLSPSEKIVILATGAILAILGFFVSLFLGMTTYGGVIELHAERGPHEPSTRWP